MANTQQPSHTASTTPGSGETMPYVDQLIANYQAFISRTNAQSSSSGGKS